MGIARRTFLVDPDGRVAHVWLKVKPEGHAADVLAHPRGGPGRTPRLIAHERDDPDRHPAPHRPTRAGDGHRGPPRRRRLRAGRHDGPLDRRRHGRPAHLLHQRRRGRGRPHHRPPRPGGDPRSRAAGGGRDHRLRGGDLPARAGRRPGQRPAPARATGGRHPGVPPGRRADDGSLDRCSAAQGGSSTPTTAPRPWRRSTPCTRRPATRWPSRTWPAPASRRTRCGGCTCSGRIRPTCGWTPATRSSASWRRCARTPARSATRPTWSSGCASGRARMARASARLRRRASRLLDVA